MSSTGRKLALASTLGIANQAVAMLIGFFLMPFLVHRLGDHLYGMWSLVAVFVGYYSLLDLGLSSAISRYMSRALGAGDQQESNTVFNTALRLFILLGGVVILISGALAALAPLFFHDRADISMFWQAILILGVSLGIGFPIRVFTGALNANLRYDITVALNLIAQIIRTALVVGVVLLGFKVVGLAWATLLSAVPMLLLNLGFAFKELPFLRIDKRYWAPATAKTLFSYSSFSFISQIADVLRFQADVAVITAVVGLAAVTHFRVAGALVQYLLGVLVAVTGAFGTVFSRQEAAGDLAALRRSFLFATKISVCVSSFMCFGLIAWGRPFIDRWMGPTYSDAYPCLVALVVGYLFALWQQPSIGLMYGISKHRFLAGLSLGEGLVNVLLSIYLGRKLGILGVALGTMIPLMVTKILIQPVYVCRIAGIHLLTYLNVVGKVAAVVTASLLVPALLAIQWVRPTYGNLFVTGALSLACYAVPIFYFSFSSEEKHQLLQAAGSRRLRAAA